jgi:hypothetical protein
MRKTLFPKILSIRFFQHYRFLTLLPINKRSNPMPPKAIPKISDCILIVSIISDKATMDMIGKYG